MTFFMSGDETSQRGASEQSLTPHIKYEPKNCGLDMFRCPVKYLIYSFWG